MISSTRPGQLIVSRGWRILLRLENGRLSSPPVDVFVNDQLVARGEVLVLNDNFCVRVNEIITQQDE